MGDSLDTGESESISLAELFKEQFPYYLAMGMTYEQFWHGDFDLAISYRKAYELKQEIKDYDFWKQGLYFYEALIDVSPILQAFAKKGTKPRPYPDKPYGLKYEEQESEEDKQRKIENERLKAVVHFKNLTKALQKEFGGKNGT